MKKKCEKKEIYKLNFKKNNNFNFNLNKKYHFKLRCPFQIIF